MTNVTIPVADEKLPINAEYEFGSGNAAFNFAFQLTSTILIHIPYEITNKAKSRIYELLNKNLADSFIVIFTFFFAGNFFILAISLFLETILSCIYLYVPSSTPPDATTAPIKYFNETAHASTPGAKEARMLDTYRTYCPEKIRATFAPRPNNGSVQQRKDEI